MLELYYFPPSRCSKKVKMALVEKGVPHKTHFVNLWKYEHLTPEYLGLNPKGLVPVVVDNGQVITESDFINQYIDEHYEGGTKLVPESEEGKASMMEWIKLQDNYPRLSWRVLSIKNHFPFPLSIIHNKLQENYSGKLPFVKEQLNKINEKDSGLKDFYEHKLEELETLEENLVDDQKRKELLSKVEYALDKVEERVATHEWLVEDKFSLADIVWLSILDRLKEVRMASLWENGKRPAIEKYLKRLRSRPSYKEVFARPYLLMPWYLLMSYLY